MTAACQLPLFDPGPPGVSARMRDRRLMVQEVVRHSNVRLLGQVAMRLGKAYSTFLRWRRHDPGMEEILRVVRDRKRLDHPGRR